MNNSTSEPVFIIAEAGVNHNGDRDKAFALVDAAADANADAVKFQTFSADRLALKQAPKAAYQKHTTDALEDQQEMLQQLELPHAWHAELQTHARQRGIEFLSTAFDQQSLSFLETLDLPLYKIPSGEITNGPLLWAFARTGKPLVLSTGMATLGEIEQALAVLAHGRRHTEPPISLQALGEYATSPDATGALSDVTLLHCTSQYPAPYSEINLKAMDSLASAFGLPIGYSDHSDGLLIPVAAVARGATIIEKHFTLDRNLPGPDHKASLEPAELREMIQQIRLLELALGNGRKGPQPSEWDTRRAARQSLVATRDIPKGTTISRDMLTTARCGGGVSAMEYWDWVGHPAPYPLTKGDPL